MAYVKCSGGAGLEFDYFNNFYKYNSSNVYTFSVNLKYAYVCIGQNANSEPTVTSSTATYKLIEATSINSKYPRTMWFENIKSGDTIKPTGFSFGSGSGTLLFVIGKKS